MSERIQAIRGMNDLLPDQSAELRCMENLFLECFSQYGYQEIRLPVLESTSLFKRTIGEGTDIVEKEMYTFNDVNGDSITLRPEGTASCVRACLEHGLLYNQQQKLWYFGPMFRHEKPQKGRYRQFNQFGVEAFGIPGAGIELELIAMCQRLWDALDISEAVSLQINTIGSLEERIAYRELLVKYFTPHFESLDDDSKRRLEKNPLRILDSKNPHMQELIAAAPRLLDTIGEDSSAHFTSLCQGLDALHISYQINPMLVRGLDYYDHTVFEWVTSHLGSQATVCAGGRYDTLVEQLGGQATPAIGFAVGAERLLLLREALAKPPMHEEPTTIGVIAVGEKAVTHAVLLSESLRKIARKWRIVCYGTGGFKSQFKKADKSGARLALILGEDEVQQQTVGVKDLRTTGEQVTIPEQELHQYLEAYLG